MLLLFLIQDGLVDDWIDMLLKSLRLFATSGREEPLVFAPKGQQLVPVEDLHFDQLPGLNHLLHGLYLHEFFSDFL